MITRRSAAIASATVIAVCAVLGVTRGQLSHGEATPTSESAPEVSASPSSNLAAAIVNINGRIQQGGIAGTGMVLTSDGVVLTNNHVVAGTENLVAQFSGQGQVYRAVVMGVDPTHDVAVIRLAGASHLPTVTLETSGAVAKGDHVTGMGNALGKNGSPVSASGVVTTLDETLTVLSEGNSRQTTLNGLIQFTAPIQPGDSGGPLFNDAGHVIGMDTAGSLPESPGGFGAAIPISAAKAIADQILAGEVSPYLESGHSGSLGVEVTGSGGGALVSRVVRGQAGAVAGIVPGDVITDIGGTPVHSAADFAAAAYGRRPGDPLAVTWRDAHAATHHASVKLSAGPPA